jgi:hypothetical protein
MEYLLAEIDRLKRSISEFDAVIPVAAGETLAAFLFHRNWHLNILAGYTQALNAPRP